MQVRRPMPIFSRYAEMRHVLPPVYIPGFAECGNILQSKMSVQGVKNNSVQLVLQHNGSAIVAFVTVKSKTVHAATNKRVYWCSGGSPYINAQVQPPRFFSGPGGIKKRAAAVHCSVFVITADTVRSARLLPLTVYVSGKLLVIFNNLLCKRRIAFGKIHCQ